MRELCAQVEEALTLEASDHRPARITTLDDVIAAHSVLFFSRCCSYGGQDPSFRDDCELLLPSVRHFSAAAGETDLSSIFNPFRSAATAPSRSSIISAREARENNGIRGRAGEPIAIAKGAYFRRDRISRRAATRITGLKSSAARSRDSFLNASVFPLANMMRSTRPSRFSI